MALRDQLLKLLKRLGVPLKSPQRQVEPILRCIASSYFPNAAYLHTSGEYRTVLNDVILQVHPTSALYTVEKSPWVVYGEVLHTTQLFMWDVSVVEADWLEELAPHYFHRITLNS